MDVARLAGVSQKTVSRVMNDEPYVSEDVRRRVLAAAEELGYRSNNAARALASGRTRSIGVVTLGTGAELRKAQGLLAVADDMVTVRRAEQAAAAQSLAKAQYDLSCTRIVAPAGAMRSFTSAVRSAMVAGGIVALILACALGPPRIGRPARGCGP